MRFLMYYVLCRFTNCRGERGGGGVGTVLTSWRSMAAPMEAMAVIVQSTEETASMMPCPAWSTWHPSHQTLPRNHDAGLMLMRPATTTTTDNRCSHWEWRGSLMWYDEGARETRSKARNKEHNRGIQVVSYVSSWLGSLIGLVVELIDFSLDCDYFYSPSAIFK